MRTVLVAGLVLVLLAGCAGGPRTGSTASATSAQTFSVHGTGTAATPGPALLQDLTTIARSEGRPLDEVLAEQRGADEFRALTDGLYGDATTGAVMAWRDDGEGFISFTHRPAAPVIARLRALPIDTTVRWGLPMTHDDLVDYSWAAFGALDGVEGIQPISGGPSTSGDAAELRYAVTGRAPTDADLRAAIRAATTAWAGRPTVPVRFTVGEASEIGTAGSDGGIQPM